MIPLGELRLGNIVGGASITSIHTIVPDDFDLFTRHPSLITPIPITEEWMLKLGIQFGFDFCKVFHVTMEDNGVLTAEQYSEGKFELPHVKYVHQLQNLFYSLTGQELEIKELVK